MLLPGRLDICSVECDADTMISPAYIPRAPRDSDIDEVAVEGTTFNSLAKYEFTVPHPSCHFGAGPPHRSAL